MKIHFPLWDLCLMSFVHSHPQPSPISVVFSELEVGRHGLMLKDFPAMDESWAPCGAGRALNHLE